MTRDELIFKIAQEMSPDAIGFVERGGRVAHLGEGIGQILDAIKEAGGIVLMRVQEDQPVANVIALHEKHVLRVSHEERANGVYVNVLEQE